ncbi:hypothetical protein JAAARDRAFT_170487 [Jaapia argillacea MUCL 33604]|uniref:Septation initiation network scaffold protein cdc11 n=1 Tax=Jaapia argillacea MUCL 33604 TaxID=933084 RepID=A0A067QFF7_9AGAM|nr:hypothetical protein JAAARDRAFT_170487 [Jaapia argillacea MUCL 33604]
MASPQQMSRPAWQTDELDEEWIEPDDDEQDLPIPSHDGSRSISMTVPLGSITSSNYPLPLPDDDISQREPYPRPPTPEPPGGTFLIRTDVPDVPAFLPKTPGRNKKSGIKDFFTPLALEKMFEPPSPPPAFAALHLPTTAPVVPSPLSQVHSASESGDGLDTRDSTGREVMTASSPNLIASHARKPSINCQFTFSVAPKKTPNPSPHPQASSTPGPPVGPNPMVAPPTDPRLRLFHFQYDTFTRDHLSAIVDSIAVGTPTGSNGSRSTSAPASTPTPGIVLQSRTHLSRVSESSDASSSRMRSTKRVRLSPASDYGYGEGAGAGATIRRPVLRRDYVSESKSLMEQIKQARDFSTVSTVMSAHSPAPTSASRPADRSSSLTPSGARVPSYLERSRPASLQIPQLVGQDVSGSGTDESSKRSGYSSLGYRKQAADLMAQIRNDMKSSRRILSGDTIVSVSQTTRAEEDNKSMASPNPKRHRSPSLDNKENDGSKTPPALPQIHFSPARSTRSTSSSRARQKQSPRRLLRRLSAADEVDREMAHEVPEVTVFSAWTPPPPLDFRRQQQPHVPAMAVYAPSPSPSRRSPRPDNVTNLLAPPTATGPSYPSTSVRLRTGEDLNRFVSSSTASGTTLTAGSSGSFAKHAGPAHMTRIGPGDIPTGLPERVGKMVFDKVMMKWVKDTARATAGLSGSGGSGRDGVGGGEDARSVVTDGTDGTSEDPFKDIDSLREDDSRDVDVGDGENQRGNGQDEVEMSRIDEVDEETEDEEEMELTSFSFDDPPAGVVHVMTGDTDTEDEEDDDTVDRHSVGSVVGVDDMAEMSAMSASMSIADHLPDLDAADLGDDTPEVTIGPISPPRARQDQSRRDAFATPLPPHRDPASTVPTSVLRSVLKSGTFTPSYTPANRPGHRRSVSFSDGKREGQISGIGRKEVEPTDNLLGGLTIPSTRSKRIANMMQGLEEHTFEEESPSKTSSGRTPTEELQPLTARRPSASNGAHLGKSDGQSPRRVFSRSHTIKSPKAVSNPKANATFLTECSFGVAHDRLVQVITDVQPFEPYWEDLSSIELSKRNLESVARLKEFLPRLDSLGLNSNQLTYLSGVPATVRTLSISSNCLSSTTSFNHLPNLENLDISRNNVDSLRQLECLRHLRELRADGNKISSLDGLQMMDGLVKLSLEGNQLHDVDLTSYRWTRLEMLNLCRNRIETVTGIASLPALIALNLDNNALAEIQSHGILSRLRILRLSGNRLHQLNLAPFPNLRTLYADNNSLGVLVKASRLTKLENLSLRNQRGGALSLSIRDVRDVKRLYLSGNPLKGAFIDEPCYNMVYLELAACRLASLPPNLARLVPNLRVLNLNYNFLEEVKGLEGLTRLKKLTMIGSRLKGTKPVIRVLQGMPEVEMLDFRMNPCTLGWYLPLLVQDVPGALQPSEGHGGGDDCNLRGEKKGGQSWQELDSKFRRDLPDDAYVGRLAYRGLVMRACPHIRMLDGVGVSEKEREKANHLLVGIMAKRGKEGQGKRG